MRAAEHITPESVYEFFRNTADRNGRRDAHALLVYADMFTSGHIPGEAYHNGGFPAVCEALLALMAHGLIDVESGPETDMYGGTPKPMVQVANWNHVRPKRAAIPKSVREAVYDRDGRACVECGSGDRLTLDHVYPWSLGGSDDADNLQTMCAPCNSSKSNKVAA